MWVAFDAANFGFSLSLVIPAKAGIQPLPLLVASKSWIPAFAGMTS
jgi:hypothetical protein